MEWDLPDISPTDDYFSHKETELPIWIVNIPRDPFHYDNCFYTVLNTLGYPLQFTPQDNRRSDNPDHEYLQVNTDSNETLEKISTILGELQKTTAYWIVRHITEGDGYKIEELMDGYDEFYYDSYEGRNIITQEGRRSYDQETLQSCFIRAQLRAPEYRQDLSAEFERLQRAHALEEKGIQAIGAEQIGLRLVLPEIETILQAKPELLPPKRDADE